MYANRRKSRLLNRKEAFMFKRNFGFMLFACLFFLVFSSFLKPANAQSYVLDESWSTKAGSVAKSGFPFSWFYGGVKPVEINYATDIAIDAANNLYVADERNNRIVKISPLGMLLKSWGTEGSSNTQFNSPYGVAVDTAGYVYVADTNNHRIQKFDSNGNYKLTIGEEGTGTGQLKHPFGITVDDMGNLYVSMSWTNYTTNKRFNCVKKFSPSGNEELAIDCVEREYERPTVQPETDFVDGKFVGAGPGALVAHTEIEGGEGGLIAILKRYVYVATGNYIMKFKDDGTYVSKFGGLPDTSGQVGKFRGIKGLFIVEGEGESDKDKIFVTEHYMTAEPHESDRLTYNYRFQKCDLGVVGRGIGGVDGFICQAFGAGVVYGPFGIALDSSGNAFITDAKGVLKFKPVDLRFKSPPLRVITP